MKLSSSNYYVYFKTRVTINRFTIYYFIFDNNPEEVEIVRAMTQ